MNDCETPDIFQFKTISEQKKFLRNRAKTFLKEYCSDSELMKQCSISAFKSITESDEYKNAPCILAFMAMKNELSLDSIIEDALKKGKRVALPRIRKSDDEGTFASDKEIFANETKFSSNEKKSSRLGEKSSRPEKKCLSSEQKLSPSNSMDFFYINNLSDATDLENAFKIREPNDNLEKLNVSLVPENSFIFVPGLCFNLEGARLGRGKGYYDRFLNSLPKNKNFCICGVCFTICVTKAIPVDENDFYVNHLLTEYGFISVK